MDYLYIVNAFKQQQQQFLLHQHQLQQQLQSHHHHNHLPPTTNNLTTIQQQLDNSNIMSNSLIWQPWRDFQQAAVHRHLYEQQQQQQQQLQQQQKVQLDKETRLTSKELPTTAWRRERRLRTGEYHHPQHHHHHPASGASTSNVRSLSPCSSPPPPAAHVQQTPPLNSSTVSNAHPISIMMAAAAAASMRPLTESANCISPSSPPPSKSTNLTAQIQHSQVLQHMNTVQNVNDDDDDVPLDMSVGNLKQRNSPPPPYREPLPGSQFSSSLARPSVITQAPPKRETRDSNLVANRENDNRSCESIDEHFRRSLGNDYFALFSKRSPASQTTKTPSPQPQNLHQPPIAHVRSPSPSSSLLLSSSSTEATTLQAHSALAQTELIPPPAYPANIQATGSHQPIPQQAHHHQHQLVVTPKAGQMKIQTTDTADSPPLPLVVRQPKCQPIALQKSSLLIAITPLTSPQSPGATSNVKLVNNTQSPIYSSAGSRTASPLPMQQHQHQPPSATAITQFASLDNSPSSSPRHTPPVLSVPQPNPSPNLPAIMRIKTEPGLQNVKSHNPTPPASPTSTTTNHNINTNSNSYSSNTSSPSSPIVPNWKSSNNNNNTGNASAEILASVDDHFAKALGDTWKKLQENKEMRK